MQSQTLNVEKLRVAAFDWDNTLSLNRDVLVKSIDKVLVEYGLPKWEIVKDKRNPDLSFRDNFPLIFGDNFVAAYEKYCAYYRELAPNQVKAPVGAIDLLNLLRDKNVKVVVVTNKDRRLLEFELPFLYQPELFDNIVCGHEAPKDKPAPQQLEFAVQKFTTNITSESVWMVGDSAMDSKCALAAGAKAVRIGNPIWGDAEKQDGRIIRFTDFSSLLQSVKEQNNA